MAKTFWRAKLFYNRIIFQVGLLNEWNKVNHNCISTSNPYGLGPYKINKTNIAFVSIGLIYLFFLMWMTNEGQITVKCFVSSIL